MSETTVGDRLRDARKRAGLTAAEVGRRAADILGRSKAISESAIRNQENGTNGVPYEAIRAYAAVLGVERSWLAFGDGSDLPEPAGRLMTVMADVGSDWSPADLKFQRDRPPLIRVNIPEFQHAKLFGSYIAGGERIPEYQPGTFIVYCWTDEVGAREGDHVVVYRFVEEALEHSLRVVRHRAEGVFLESHPGGAVQAEPIRADDQGVIIFGVVVATYRLVPPNPGPLLVTNSGMSAKLTEKLLT